MTAYPLNWPPGRPRLHGKDKPLFKVSLDRAVQGVLREVRQLGGTDLTITTNQQLRKDGLPYSRGTVYDVGVAVYFTYRKKQVCFCCDRWWSLEGNMRAVALTIGALRGIERWGTGDMMMQAFTGFAQLPAPEQPWQVLGVSSHASRDEIEAAYRKLAHEHHPDRGGDEQTMMRINRARDALLET